VLFYCRLISVVLLPVIELDCCHPKHHNAPEILKGYILCGDENNQASICTVKTKKTLERHKVLHSEWEKVDELQILCGGNIIGIQDAKFTRKKKNHCCCSGFSDVQNMS